MSVVVAVVGCCCLVVCCPWICVVVIVVRGGGGAVIHCYYSCAFKKATTGLSNTLASIAVLGLARRTYWSDCASECPSKPFFV